MKVLVDIPIVDTMGIDPCIILNNQCGIKNGEGLKKYISEKTGLPIYNERDNNSEAMQLGPYLELRTLPDFAGYEALDFTFKTSYRNCNKNYWDFSSEDYFIITPSFVLCRIASFECITWKGILKVFQLNNDKEQEYLHDSWQHMIHLYKEFGKIFYSNKILVCSDADCEEILELIKESFTEKILEMHNYKLLCHG